jgi:hypothetical protein
VNLDVRAERAAASLRDATQVDTEAGLESLYRLEGRRSTRRHVAWGVLAAVVVATVWAGHVSRAPDRDRPELTPAAGFPPLGRGYDVTDTDVSPDGDTEAVATYRDGEPAVVLVRGAGTEQSHVIWSAPTAHELGDRNVPWPAAVSWAADGSRIAILVAQERGPRDEVLDLVDLTLVTVNSDGTGREVVDVIGRCWCTGDGPTVTWMDDAQVEVGIPDGPDEGQQTRELP